jgi:alpha-methylacyl-CoA racemase
MGPLQGIRVVEFSGLGAAPYGVMLLADLGADVVRIDRPNAAHDPSLAGHLGVARGRRSVTLDLKHPEAVGIIDRLLAGADVLVEGFRPGVMERLGLGPDALLARHPHLVYARMTGFGQDGPLARRAGHDINYAALAGALHPVGEPTSPPPPVFNALADLGGGGTFLAIGVLAALVEHIGAALEEQHAEDVFLELRGIHLAAQYVGGFEEVAFELGQCERHSRLWQFVLAIDRVAERF